MKTILIILAGCFINLNSFAQLVVTGSGSSTSVANNAPAIIVDNNMSITGSGSIDAAKVSISTNFSTGDVLAFTGSLPGTVTSSYNSTTGVFTFTGTATAAQYQTLLRTVTFRTTSASAAQRTITFNLGSAISFSGNGHFYEFITGSFNWSAARTDAATKTFYGLQGYLVTITSQSENDFIQQKLSADGWIGASDDYTFINAATGASTYATQAAAEGKWHWVTGPVGEKGIQFSNGNGTPVSVSSRYMNWNAGEPNNSGGTEHYGQIYSSSSTGKWNDLGASSLGYVVEYGGMSGDPAVTLSASRNIVMIATSIQTTDSSVVYALHATAAFVDDAMNVYSNGSITDAKVTVSTNFKSGDVLSYSGSLPVGVTAGYNSTTGVLSFTGTATANQWQSLFRTVKFNSTSNVIGNRAITFSVGNQVAGSNGHFYEYVSTAASWTTSLTNAASKTYLGLGGYLATITSQAENDFIKQKIGANAWIGASDDRTYINAATGTNTYADQTAAEGKWYWVTGPVGEKGIQFSNGNGTPVAFGGNYMNWNSGEPNNSGTNEHYGQIFASGSNLGKWNDLPNSSTLGYVVEYGGLASDPLLYLSASRTMAVSTILPVTGLEFNAFKSGDAIQLVWSTSNEINTDQFDILYSVDGNYFSKIGEMAAAGNTTQSTSYKWLHKGINYGYNYYQLKAVDLDGRFKLSTIKSVFNKSKEISVSPNPASSTINFSFSYTGQAVHLIIRNSLGAVVYQQQLNTSQTTIDISKLVAGYYLAEIKENGVVNRISFIKQ